MNSRLHFDFSPRTADFPHQPDAIRYVETNDNSALFDEQGLGKTKIVIAALCNNMRDDVIDGALIVCRKHLVKNWSDEITRHSHLNSISLLGSKDARGLEFMGFAHFYMVNYEAVISERSRLTMFLSTRKMALVLDEAHRIKNPKAASTRAILSLRGLVAKRVIVTGTPLANKPEDLWAQFYFLDGGALLGQDFREFSAYYSVDVGKGLEDESKSRLDKLRTLVLSHSMRRLKGDVLQLPTKTIETRQVPLAGKQATLYYTMRDELFVEVTNMSGQHVVEHAEMLLKRLMRLVQLASNPGLLDSSYDEVPAKFAALDDIVSQVMGFGEKLIIWTSFVANAHALADRYAGHGVALLIGAVPIERRGRLAVDFQNNSSCRIVVANPAAAREGLTLTAANHAVYVDRSFNLVDYLQSQDRIHRISQTRDCTVVKLIADNTIDEYVDDILVRKSSVARFVEGDSGDIIVGPPFTRDEILGYLGGSR